jgi:hypothetical protein
MEDARVSYPGPGSSSRTTACAAYAYSQLHSQEAVG